MNNKSKKTNQNQSTMESVLYFPNKLNILTIFLIVILYGTVLFVSASAVFPEISYVDVPNYGPSTYNEEISAHALYFGSAEKDNNDPSRYKVTTKIYSYVRPKNSAKIDIIKYSMSGLDSNGAMRYYIENPRRNDNKYYSTNKYYTDVYRHTFSNEVVLRESTIDKIYVKVNYRLTVDEVEEIKTLKFYENVLKLSSDELSSSKFGSNTNNDLLTVNLSIKERATDKTQYDSSLKLLIADKAKAFHINFQSWLVTENNEILPFIGLYNYSYNLDFDSSNLYMKKVDTAKWVYARLVYTDIQTGEVSELFFKTSINL